MKANYAAQVRAIADAMVCEQPGTWAHERKRSIARQLNQIARDLDELSRDETLAHERRERRKAKYAKAVSAQ